MITAADLASVIRHPAGLDALVTREGLAPVLALAGAEGVDAWLADARADVDALAARRRHAVLEETLKCAELQRVSAALTAHGIAAVVLKGGALAYTHYAQPWLRPRYDLDLLVPHAHWDRAVAALQAIGYTRTGLLQGRLLIRQDELACDLAAGLRHVVDLHWEATNRAFFIARLPARDLLDRTVPAPYAGGATRQLTPIDNLLVAAVHRAAHHAGHRRLIWLYDEWLVARALDDADVGRFVARAAACGLASLCGRDLAEARDAFGDAGGALRPAIIAELERLGAAEPARRIRAPERDQRSRLRDLGYDLRALPRWRDRGRLVIEHLLPPPSFVLADAGTSHTSLLPWLYARRLISGSVAWTREWIERR